MILIDKRMATRAGTIEAVAGMDRTRAPCLILLAALWHDDLAEKFAGRVKAGMFTDNLLRTVAAFSVGNVSTLGTNDPAATERLLRERFPEQAVAVTIDTIRTLSELIEVDDVENAIEVLNDERRSAA